MRCSALCVLACGLLVLAVTEARSTSLKTYLQHLKARQAPPPCSEDEVDNEFERCFTETDLEIPIELMQEFMAGSEEDEEDEEGEEGEGEGKEVENGEIKLICKLYEKNKGEKFGKFLDCFKGECTSIANDMKNYLIPVCDYMLQRPDLKKKHTEQKNIKLLRKVLKLLAARK